MTTCSSVRSLLLIAAAFTGAAGCQTYQAEVKTMAGAWSGNQLETAAKQFGERADKESQTKDGVLWHLEAGAAYRAIGAYPESNRHLETAAAQVDDHEQQARVRVGQETMAVMSNQQNLPYVGRSYDKIMLHTYKALNHLALGEVEKARPEIIRAYQRQQDAVEENNQRIEKAREEERQAENRAEVEKARADRNFSQALDGVTSELEGFKFYADYVNPFTVYLDALYFMYAGADASDLERARKSLKRIQEIAGDNKSIQADLDSIETASNVSSQQPVTYVLFETGQAPQREQVRIDIPIIVTSVSYVGAAFPKLVFPKDYAPELTVTAGDVQAKTATLASLDAIVALDFKNEWPVILTKTIVSTVAKGVAAYAINEAVGRQSSLLGLVAQIATAAAQAAVNIADTRTWTTLPKEFQIARVPTPPDRKIILEKPGAAPLEVVLEEGVVNVVCAKSITTSDRLLVSQFKLK